MNNLLTDAEAALAEVLELLDRLDASGQDYDTDIIRAAVPAEIAARVRGRSPVVRKMLDLSTAHLPPELGLSGLDQVPGVIAFPTDRGWLLWVPDDPEDSARAVGAPPEPVMNIQLYARRLGCDYVLFDAEGDENPDLIVFDGAGAVDSNLPVYGQ